MSIFPSRYARLWMLPLALGASGMLTGCQTLSDTLSPQSLSTPAPPSAEGACRSASPRTILVTGFALRRPEHLPPGSRTDWPQSTATALARTMEESARVRAVGAPGRFPFPAPDVAPVVEKKGTVPVVAIWARETGAQFVLSGVFHDFSAVPGPVPGLPGRHLAVEAYLFDGQDGQLAARKTFAWNLPMHRDVPRANDPGPGEKAFSATRFGRMYDGLIGEIARWAEAEVACRKEAVPRPGARPIR